MASKFELRDTVPVAPGGKINVKWQSDIDGNVSAYVDPAGGGGVAFQTPWLSDIDAAGYSLTNTGNVGIGTASPGVRLHVVGGRAVVENPEIVALGLRYTSSSPIAWIGSNPAGDCLFCDNGGQERMRIGAAGNVAIGSFPLSSTPLRVHCTDTAILLSHTTATKTATINYNVAGINTVQGGLIVQRRDLSGGYEVSLMYLDIQTGNLGIGTLYPHSKLAVTGLAYYATNVAAVAAGLTPGDFYVISGTLPAQVAVVV